MYVVGIDIGGTKIKCGLFSESGELLQLEEIKTPKKSIVQTIISKIKEMTKNEQILGIGVASAGIVDFQQGMITQATNLPSLENKPLQQALKDEFQVTVIVDNDANCAAITEGVIGAAQSVSNYICITLGTGIGGGIVHNNKLVHGINGYSGEVGHMSIFPYGIPCDCGKNGCWEKYASGRALERMIQENSYLASNNYTPKALFDGYAKVAACTEIIDDFIEYVSIGIINLQYMIDPEMIVIGGGVINSNGEWWNELLKKVAISSPIPVNLQKAQLKNNASIIGANYLVRK